MALVLLLLAELVIGSVQPITDAIVAVALVEAANPTTSKCVKG